MCVGEAADQKEKEAARFSLGRMFRTLYRTVVVLSALIVVFFCAYKALVKPPEQAAPPPWRYRSPPT